MIKKGSLSILMVVCALGMCGCPPIHVHERPVVVKESGPPPWAPAHGHRAKHHYYYYPGPAVYYDVDRKVYFYPQSGEWRTAASLPVGIHIDVNSYSVLDMDNDRPYVYHDEVVKRYPPGQLKKLDKDKNKKWK